ncbi:hypothetical protein N7491_006977 [Penicillium cf. griseofulvum]|uniref:Cell wall protein n=1 Tax=Penicillium cf. griseofulvum TaxID=2972120 RepID=A0A9W9M2J7_9EURO|nr:hypothetical protein N7472_009992 [Penicillium cf. griseofulvum]KAJ5429961.1 hypothetical protein N7491_006977 [Penicillium cf. griseofulvum]KAJ5436264.1 hypothetical protein N7445_007149 [Penicillium cf. griseofulvum]
MQYTFFATIFLAATALAAPADSAATPSLEAAESNLDLNDVPSSILAVLVTAIPDSWYSDIMDPASLSAIASAASAGTYPAWYNALPNSVKSWATDFGGDLAASALTTADSSATPTEPAGSSAIETGSSIVIVGSNTASQTSNAATTTSDSSTSASTSGSSSDSSSRSASSASSSPSSTRSTGGAPAPTGGVAMGVAGAAGILALALAL